MVLSLVVAENMRRVRREQELTVKQMAFRLGMSESYVYKVESCSVPLNLEVIKSYSDILDVPLDHLIVF